MATYPTPFCFPIARGVPLLILSCSAVKRPVRADQLVRFADLYNGPMWQQVKASGFPLTNVAAISALYGFLEPGTAVRTYDQAMDDESSRRISGTGCHVHRLGVAVAAAGSAFVVGGALYQEAARMAQRRDPSLPMTFASGSYLAQRKQLRLWLERAAAT